MMPSIRIPSSIYAASGSFNKTVWVSQEVGCARCEHSCHLRLGSYLSLVFNWLQVPHDTLSLQEWLCVWRGKDNLYKVKMQRPKEHILCGWHCTYLFCPSKLSQWPERISVQWHGFPRDTQTGYRETDLATWPFAKICIFPIFSS